LLEPARIVARVGDQVILAGDVEGTVNILMAVQLKDVPPEELEKASEQLDAMRRGLFKQALKAEVNTKLGYLDFMRTVPPEKHAELQKRVKQNFEREFDEVRTKLAEAKTDEQKAELVARNMMLARLAVLMQHYQLDNLGQLDAHLRTLGSSLDKQQRAYGEQKLQQMAVMRNIRQNVEITHEQMLEYYRGHLDDYAIPAKARWEQLTVRFDRFSTEGEAVAALAEMGNAVYLGGASLAAVAKKSSQEPNAEDGGLHDWTQKGSLASKPLDEAIFSLPTGRLSQMIRDDRGLHIVRVLDRTEASHKPFVDAQVEIKEHIRTERRNKDIQAYFDKVRTNTTVWTIDDEPQAETPGRPTAPTPPGQG
jgi:parvulin-like peptidyl-prolyl isomerase